MQYSCGLTQKAAEHHTAVRLLTPEWKWAEKQKKGKTHGLRKRQFNRTGKDGKNR